MSIFTWIRHILGIQQDRVETKKAKLEGEKFEKESGPIAIPKLEDINKYNPKTVELAILIRQLRVAKWGSLIGFFTLIATVIIGILTLEGRVNNIQFGVNEVGSRVERVEKDILKRQFTITTPGDGTIVNLTDLIRGKTPFPKMNHYIVVTPLKTGDDWIEEGQVKVYAGGLWTGRARFGTATAGAGEEFVVRVIATKSTLSPGTLTVVPKDAIFSEPITVTRKK